MLFKGLNGLIHFDFSNYIKFKSVNNNTINTGRNSASSKYHVSKQLPLIQKERMHWPYS